MHHEFNDDCFSYFWVHLRRRVVGYGSAVFTDGDNERNQSKEDEA